MQDNFVGDSGDVGKCGLLRVLTGRCPERPSGYQLALGVVWSNRLSMRVDGSLTR